MIRAIGELNNRRTLFVGLDRRNTTRMHEDEPIVVDAQALLAAVGDERQIQDIIIFAEETPEEAHARLKGIFPDLPEYKEAT